MKDDKSNILFPVLLMVPLLALLWVIATQVQPSTSTPIQTAVAALYRTTAMQLYRDYNDDAVRTQQRIGQRRILVTGTIVDVSYDYLGQELVLLDAGNGISTADMTLAADQNALALQLKRGQNVSMSCEQMQRYSDSPTGSECTLAALTPAPMATEAEAPSASLP